ncbi:MAG: hypothetical protein ACJAYC_002315 [Halieaceae bacterium]|jgi:hypothetical protein
MSATEADASKSSPSRLDVKQWIKLVVYGLLVINFALYVIDDWQISTHTLRNGGTFFDYTSAFAVTLDTLAWLTLLTLFELETYLLSAEAFTRRRVALMHGIRLICILFLAHTLAAYWTSAIALNGLVPVENVQNLCQLSDQGVSYGFNLSYTELDETNCETLSSASEFYTIENDTIITTAEGLRIDQELLWLDLAEAAVWIVILLCIETVVRLQDKNITTGARIGLASTTKKLLYSFLWAIAAYWVYRGHYMYAWDEALWILGFLAIEMNLSAWKAEITEKGSAN